MITYQMKAPLKYCIYVDMAPSLLHSEWCKEIIYAKLRINLS